MNTKSNIQFSDLNAPTSFIVVSRTLPSGSKEIIGRVFQNYNDEEGSVEYVSYDKEGNNLTPDTGSWSDVEREFEMYAKRLERIEPIKQNGITPEEKSARVVQVDDIRKGKNKRDLEHQLNH